MIPCRPRVASEVVSAAPIARVAVAVIGFCLTHARLVVVIALALAVVCGAYAVGNFLTIAGVVYGALTTATAFGSSWFSSDPGASSMGKLVALSLACTLAAAVLFQPILMGKPRSPAPRAYRQ